MHGNRDMASYTCPAWMSDSTTGVASGPVIIYCACTCRQGHTLTSSSEIFSRARRCSEDICRSSSTCAPLLPSAIFLRHFPAMPVCSLHAPTVTRSRGSIRRDGRDLPQAMALRSLQELTSW